MPFRVIAFICFLFCGAICGAVLSDKLRKERDFCRKVLSMFSMISGLLRHRALNVYEIVHELNMSQQFGELNFLSDLPDVYRTEENFHDSWRDCIQQDETILAEERELLLSFGSTFGTTDVVGQLLNIESAIERFSEIERLRSENYRCKGKMYRSIGLLFGAMAGIMII